jgi:hypothetical protein
VTDNVLLRLSDIELDRLRFALCETLIQRGIELRRAPTSHRATDLRHDIHTLGAILERLAESVTEEPAPLRSASPERAAAGVGSEGLISTLST